MDKSIIYFVFACLSPFFMMAQADQPNAPTASVYNYSKYADVQPDLSTGAISESLPFGSVSSGPLAHGVGLSYYFAGHRPGALSSPVGLGWDLVAGGAVTRTIRGLDDFGPNGWDTNPPGNTQNIANGTEDGEADLFSLQVGGMNLKFVMDKNGICHQINKSDLELTHESYIYQAKEVHRFILTDNAGSKYYFGSHPSANGVSNTELMNWGGKYHYTTWYLTKIETHDTSFDLDFDYEDNKYAYYSLQDCSVQKYNLGSGSSGYIGGSDCQMSAQEVKVEGHRLSKITGTNNHIDFNYADRRDDLLPHAAKLGSRLSAVVLHNGSYSKTYELIQDYFTDPDILSSTSSDASDLLDISTSDLTRLSKKLRLKSVQEKSGGESLPAYQFQYFGPNHAANGSTAYSVVSKAYDLYGIANGKKHNNDKKHIIPYTLVYDSNTVPSSFGHTGGIRDANHNYGVVTGLSKMILPTGGNISYEYQGHSIYETGAIIEEVSVSSNITGVPMNYPFSLTQNQIDNGQLSWTFTNPTSASAKVRIRVYQNGINPVHDDEYTSSGSLSLSNLDNMLSPGSGSLQITTYHCSSTATISYPEIGTKDFEYGGVRLAKRSTDDGHFTDRTIVREFTYNSNCGAGSSSGKLFRRPITAYSFIAKNFIYSTASIQPFTSATGSYLAYQESQVIYKDGSGDIGKTCNTYYTDNNIALGDYPPVPEYSQHTVWGQLNETQTYDASGKRLSGLKNHIVASELSVAINTVMTVARQHSYKQLNGNIGTTLPYQTYVVRAGTFRPTIQYAYSETLDSIKATSQYFGLNHLQMTQKEVTYPSGRKEKSTYDYSFDQGTTATAITAMVDRNILTPTLSESFIDNAQTTKVESTFKIVGTHPRPASTIRTAYDQTANTSTETDLFVSYNTKGQLTLFNAHDLDYNNKYSYNASTGLLESIGTTGAVDFKKEYTYHTGSTLLHTATEADGTTLTYDYDDLMRLRKITFPNLTTHEIDYNITTGANPSTNQIYTKDTYPVDANGLSSLTLLESYKYLDGLGRTVQSVGKEQTSYGTDQVVALAYDNQGKIHKTYQPYSSGGHAGGYSSTYANEPFTLHEYEASPLQRVATVTDPVGYITSYTYGTNGSIKSDAAGTAIPVNTLLKTTVIDGNGNSSSSYSDLQGRSLIQERNDGSSTASIATKMAYDWKNRLTEVVPPGSTITTDALNFIYEYDLEGKLTRKKIPSADWIEYVYDDRDIQHAYQDGNLKEDGKWYQNRMDDYGRQVASGIHNLKPTSSNILPSNTLTTTTYGTTGTAKGKVSTSTSKLEGTANFLTSTTVYDAYGRVDSVRYNNVLGLSGSASSSKNFYDGASNVVMTKSRTYDHKDDLTTITNTTIIDDDGRTTATNIQINNGIPVQLCQLTYDEKDLVATKYQGGNLTSHLQKIDYTYLDNQALHKVNEGNSSGTDLFGYQINYNQDFTGWNPGTNQLNGNIKSTSWKEVGSNYYIQSYGYDYLNRLETVTTGEKTSATSTSHTKSGHNNTTYTYDDRGNFDEVSRKHNNVLIDDLNYNYDPSNTNQLLSITEDEDTTEGYKKINNSNYSYDANGNIDSDPQKGISITYNHLDLPTTIDWDDGRQMRMMYDGSGTLHQRTLYDADNNQIQRRDYLGQIEYIEQLPYTISHDQGRIINRGVEAFLNYVYLDHQQSTDGIFKARNIASIGSILDEQTDYKALVGIEMEEGFAVDNSAVFSASILPPPTYTADWSYEWDIRDHLGNLRLSYSDLNGNGSIDSTTEVLQRQDYFAYGMRRNNQEKSTLKNNYQYNGIEHVPDFGLDWSMATYRSLMSDVGIWGGVDPKAESTMSLTPYGSMNQNPINNIDPDGDSPILIGAAIGLMSNGIGNIMNGQNFFQGGFQAAAFGAIGGGISAGIGSAAQGMANAGASQFGVGAFQAGAHALSGGALSSAQGGNFLSGAASGAFSSAVGSGIAAADGGGFTQWLGGGLSGGVGSSIAGGGFWDGAGQGLITGGLNHAADQIQYQLTKARLITAAKRAGLCTVCTHNEIGDIFEIIVAAGLFEDGFVAIPGTILQTPFGNTIPDFYIPLEGDKSGTTHMFGGLVEVKAKVVGSRLGLSSQNSQIFKQIVGHSLAWGFGGGTHTLVTTSGVRVSPRIQKFALFMGIRSHHLSATYSGRLSISNIGFQTNY